MEDNKVILKGGFIILAIAAILFAVWRVLDYNTPSTTNNLLSQKTTLPTKHVSKESTLSAEQKSLEDIRMQELLGPSEPLQARPTDTEEKLTNKNRINLPRPHSSILPSSSVTTPTGKNTEINGSYRSAQQSVRNNNANKTSTPSKAQNLKPQIYHPTPEDELEKERMHNLAPFLINHKQQEEIDQKLSSLSANIARALQRALTPKSKKDANIEKYLNRGGKNSSSSATGTEDPFAAVINQITNQKADIVKSMTNSFGTRAGQRAGQLMDNFSKEVTSVANSPAQTDQQKAKKIQQIAYQYNRKFEQLNQQSQYEKFVQERIEQDTQQKNALAAKYPNNDALNAEFSRIIDEARQRDLALSQQTELSRDQYYTALQDSHYQKHLELEETVKKAGVSLSGLHQVDNEQVAEDLKNREMLANEGKIISVPRVASTEETKRLEKRLNKESEDMLKQVESAFGKERASGLQIILDNYHNAMLQTMQQEIDDNDRLKKQMKLRNDSNRQILEWQQEQIRQLDLPPEQKKQALERIEQELENLSRINLDTTY